MTLMKNDLTDNWKRVILLLSFIMTLSLSYSQDLKLKDTARKEVDEERLTKLGEITETTQIYLRGTFNQWLTTNSFNRVSDGVYEMNGVTLYNGRHGIKVGSEDWKVVDLGGNGQPIVPDEDYPISVGGENIFISGIEGQANIYIGRIVVDLNRMIMRMERDTRRHPHLVLNYPDDTEFMTDKMMVHVSFNPDAVKGSIKIEGKEHVRIINVEHGDSLAIGQDEPYNTTISIVSIAVAEDGTMISDTVRYVKSEPTGVYVYFNNPAGWEKPYCYLWSLRGDQNYAWPGEAMEWDAEKVINGQKGWWKTMVSNRYADYGEVIFNNNATLQTDIDLSMEGTSMYFDGKDWQSCE